MRRRSPLMDVPSTVSPLFSPYNQTSDAFWDVDICGVTTYGSNERTSDVNRV